MKMLRRIPTPDERAEKFARFMTQRLRCKKWCKSVNTDILDISWKPTDPLAQAAGLGDYDRACARVRLDPSGDLVLEMGLLPFSSKVKDIEAWEAEVAALNNAHKKVIEERQRNYNRKRQIPFRRHRSNRRKLISPSG